MTAKALKVWLLRSKTAFLRGFLFLAASASIGAQETLLDELPELRERAVVMRIVSRIVEQNQQVVWNSENSRVTLPGRPVGLKLVGANVVVAVQFTPVLRAEGQHLLVAQGQIWTNVPGEGMRYHATMQTIPLEFNEQIFFFPLGSTQADEASIEIQLVVEPYSPETFAARRQDRDAAAERGRPDAPRGDGETAPRRWGNPGPP